MVLDNQDDEDHMIEIMNKLSIVAAAQEDDDGTPDVQVIDADNDKSF